MFLRFLGMVTVLAASFSDSSAQGPGTVAEQVKISATSGGLLPGPSAQDEFGSGVAVLGDLDGDGISEVAVGAPLDDDGIDSPFSQASNRGSVWILFLNADGTVRDQQKINQIEGGLIAPEQSNGARFGTDLAGPGDIDGDGIPDLAVGAPFEGNGIVYVLFLNSDGTVKGEVELSSPLGFLSNSYGRGIGAIGDLDNDGTPDLAIGAPSANFGRGIVWVTFLQPDGSVRESVRISEGEGGFVGPVQEYDLFGMAIDGVGDINSDGVLDIAVGAPGDTATSSDVGVVWVLRMNADGTVQAETAISKAQGGFTGALGDNNVGFGQGVASIGDINGDGIDDLAIGTPKASKGSPFAGALWICTLRAQGTVMASQEISELEGGFAGNGQYLGYAATHIGDITGDGLRELVVSNVLDDDGGDAAGAVFVFSIRGSAKSVPYGCANPDDSFVTLAGAPAPGATITLGIDNPLGTQAAGAWTFAAFSTASAAGFPCGVLLPGLGMKGADSAGELLIDVGAGSLLSVLSGPAWLGPGLAAPLEITLPNQASLFGATFFAQGLLVDPTPGAALPIALGGALALTIGG